MTAPASPEKQAKKSGAVVWLSVTFILILLIATAPLIVSFAAGGIASASGCEVSMEVSSPGMVMGSEVSHGLLGYFAFYSPPFGAFLLAIWGIIACIVALVRWLRRRHATV